MASTYTPLGVELMATGENAGTWGTKTNTNLQIFEQISGGYLEVSIAGGAGTTTLTESDGATGSAVATRILKFTGTITGNRIVTLPVGVENFYVINNATSGAYTVQLKAASGSGATVTWATTGGIRREVGLLRGRTCLGLGDSERFAIVTDTGTRCSGHGDK